MILSNPVLEGDELRQALKVPFVQGSVKERTDAVRIADIQYRAGHIHLLWLQTLQTEQITAAKQSIQLQATQRINRIQLDLALGRSYGSTEVSAAEGPGTAVAIRTKVDRRQ